MPKSTHDHQKEASATDRKFRPDDEKIYTLEKQEFQGSEKEKLEEEEKFTERAKAGEKESEE